MNPTVYEREDDGVSVLWDSARHMPVMPMDVFERRAARLEAIIPSEHQAIVHRRLTDGSDHEGVTAHPFDAGQLHVWELWAMEREGFTTRIPHVWVSPDGLANTLTNPQATLPLDEVAAEGFPILRQWMAGEEDHGLPYRFRLIRV